jgi:hypothetical protein
MHAKFTISLKKVLLSHGEVEFENTHTMQA